MTTLLTTKFLSYCLYLVLLVSESNCQSVVIQDFSTIIDGNLRNILLLDNNILVGSTNNLFRLDADNLDIKTTVNLTGANRLLLLLKPIPGIDDGNVLACQEADCSLFDSNLETVTTVSIGNDAQQAESVVPGLDDLVAIAGTNQTFFLAKDHYNAANNIESILSKFSYDENSDQLQLSLVAKQIEGSIFIQRTFLTSFEYDTFVYIVYDLFTGNSMDSRLRIVRFCANETGSSTPTFTTYTETKLKCNSGSSDDDSQITSAATVTVGSVLKVLVAFHSASTNYICSYNITDINQAMDDKLEECKLEIGKVNLVRAGQSACPTELSDFQRNLNTPCFRTGQFRLPLESDGFLEGSIILSSLAIQPFSSIESINYENIVYIIGGLNGAIEQFYYANNGLSYIRSVNLTMTNDAIQEIHVSNNSDFYYVLSNKSVVRYPVNVCEQYSSCQTCVESLDPLCGWCTLYSRCTKLSDCTSSPQIWATSNNQCPIINSIEPSFVYASQLDDINVMFTINYESIPNITYDCVYQFDDMITVSSVPAQVATNSTIVCSLPSINIFPEFGARNTLSADLSLRTMGDIDIISGQEVQFTNCSTQSTCFSCLNSSNECYWCSESLKCNSETESCLANEVIIEGTNPKQSCPFIQQPTDTDNYLIHNQIEQELTIRAENLQNLTAVCIIMDTITNINYTLSVTSKNNTHIICNTTEFNVLLTAANPILEATLLVSVNNVPIENPDNTKAVFYSCPLLGSNCGHCLSIDSMFNCVYCDSNDQCILSRDCIGAKYKGIDDFGNCKNNAIDSFYPTAGPLQGSTTVTIQGVNLGADSSQVTDISIGTVKCNHIASRYLPGRSITCTTDETTTAIFKSIITITFTSLGTLTSFQKFSFLIPKLDDPPVVPPVGPRAGGTQVYIKGRNIGIGSTRSITMAGQPCIIINETEISADATNITCITASSNSTTVRGQGATVVNIDGYTETALGFDYDNNPSFESISPLFSIQSGGTVLVVKGRDLDTVQQPRLLFYESNSNHVRKRDVGDSSFLYGNPLQSEPCFDILDSEMKCLAPNLGVKNDTVIVELGLKMDNVQDLLFLHTNINVYVDPIFENNHNFDIQPGQTRNLSIKGQHFNFELNQMTITVEEVSLPCIPVKLTGLSEVVCEIEISDNIPEGQYSIRINIGNYNEDVGTVTIDKPFNQLIIIISVFAVLVVIVIVIFIVSFSIFYRKYKQKDQQNDLLLFELDRLESSMAHECKLGFAELQTDVDELTGDLTGSRLPYHDFQVYLLQSLFPGAKDHPVLHELQLPPQKKIQTERALKDFHHLVLNKPVLMAIIQALESERAFTIRDKSNMGSLLMLALHDRLDYATHILKSLLSNLVRKTVADSYPKLLLRRTESVAEKMLSSWLAFTLHGYVIEHTGQPLYRLFKAVKAQLEKGPIDVVTGEARYSLSEQKLIRQQIQVTVINATVETEDGLQIPVKLLDCDSISQAKEKMLDAVHKNAPVSQRPALTDIDIEYRTAPKENGITLRDEDGSNEMESSWRKINTLSHYWIPDRAVFRLVTRHDRPAPGRVFDYTGSLMVTHGCRNRSISEAEDGWRVWHLFKQHEEDPRSSPFISKKMVTEIYLPRMLSTKTILQSFVDNLFSSIFTLSQPPISPSQLYTPINTTFSPLSADQGYAPGTDSLPVPIKYLFDFLDDEASNAKITDTDVLHTWKNNSLALRFWVNMIKNPEFVFDINKSAIVDSCLSVIAQAFIDGCSSSDAKPTINSPTSKLLFNKEVQGYKTNVKRYYEQISELPRIPDEMMDTYLTDLSTHQSHLIEKSGNFHTESALNEIMRYCIKYKESIFESLRANGLESEAQLLDSVIHRSI